MTDIYLDFIFAHYRLYGNAPVAVQQPCRPDVVGNVAVQPYPPVAGSAAALLEKRLLVEHIRLRRAFEVRDHQLTPLLLVVFHDLLPILRRGSLSPFACDTGALRGKPFLSTHHNGLTLAGAMLRCGGCTLGLLHGAGEFAAGARFRPGPSATSPCVAASG